jgi:hypothetical protein
MRLQDKVGAGLALVFIYLDDILLASLDKASSLKHLQIVLQRLHQYGLLLNLSKCVFVQSTVDFLGHRVSESRAEPLTNHLEATQVFLQPQNHNCFQSFRGLVNFYSRFIPAAGRILLLLTLALHGGKNKKLKWSTQMDASFEITKSAVRQATRLSHQYHCYLQSNM